MRRVTAWVTVVVLIVAAWSALWYGWLAKPSERDAAAFAEEVRASDPGVAPLWIEAQRIDSAAIWASGVMVTVIAVAVAAYAVERRRKAHDAAA